MMKHVSRLCTWRAMWYNIHPSYAAMQLCTSAGELACGIPKDFTRDSLAIFPLGRAVPRTDSSTREVELELPKWKEGKFLAGHLERMEMEHDGTELPILEVPRCSRGMMWYDMLPVFFALIHFWKHAQIC